MNGAIGIMIYNDPKDYGPVPADKTYPKSMWMPRDGVQRGSIGLGDGDILTPGWPSTGNDPFCVAYSCIPVKGSETRISKLIINVVERVLRRAMSKN